MKLINIMTCGSVDDGKSTLLGRLIYETNNLYVDQSHSLEKLNAKYKKNETFIDYSLLLDGLIDEKEQGITIDIAFKYFVLNKTQFTLVDSPGHKEFTKNMANAATFADAALILLDITNGISSQTKKHLEIINLFPNVQRKFICINKIDKINYSKTKILNFIKELRDFINFKNYEIDEIIPISALKGDNLISNSKKTSFYKGKTVYEVLTDLQIKKTSNRNNGAIVKYIDNSTSKRLYFLENSDLNFKIGDTLNNLYTGESSKVKKIYNNFSSVKESAKLKNLTIEISPEISINKGDSLVLKNNKEILSNSIKSKIFWFSETKLIKNKMYKFKFRGKTVSGFISKIESSNFGRHSVVEVQIELNEKVHIAPYEKNYFLSQFLIVESDSNMTQAFGYVTSHLDKGRTVKEKQLQEFTKSDYMCLWFTGLPASGKSSIAEALGKKLASNNIKFYILDGDNLRSTINKDLGFKVEDRIENNRRIAHIAKILFDSGVLPIVTTISPNDSSRKFARSLFSKNEFSLIYIDTPLEECIKRDPKNLYKDKLKKVKNITGLHSDYQIPKDYDLVLQTKNLSLDDSVFRLLKHLNI
tara:strand:- start:10372 stop:12132 length:1761 start_codon:yes stop_codon:yes gene_type:complete